MEIKKLPEDFKVTEKTSIEIKNDGNYTYFIMDKTDYNTVKALETIANALHIPFKEFGFAGNKDKKAITSQTCSVKNVSKERLEKIELKDIKITYLGKGNIPVSLGSLLGNAFEILVRDAPEPKPITKFINYFGKQRFGGNNIEVGRAIVKKDFKKACELAGLDTFNAVQSITKLNKKVQRIYVHAYQSYIWNETVKRMKKQEEIIPIVGFGVDPNEITKEIMKEEEITQRDFIIRQIPELSAEGTQRNMFCEVKKLEIKKKGNDVLLKFFLPKSCYATVFIDQLFNK